MEIVHAGIIALAIGLTLAALAGLLALLWYRVRYTRRMKQQQLMVDYMTQGLSSPEKRSLYMTAKKHPRKSLDAFIELAQSLTFQEGRVRKLLQFLLETGVHRFFIHRLTSRQVYHRLEAAVYLGYLPHMETSDALEQALAGEQDVRVKLAICNSLADIGSPTSIGCMVQSLLGEANWYRTRVNMLLASYKIAFAEYVPRIIHMEEIEIKSLLVDFGSVFPSDTMKQYLTGQLSSDSSDLRYRAVRALAKLYQHEIVRPEFYGHSDPVIRNIIIKSMVGSPQQHVIDILIPFLADEQCAESAAFALSDIARKRPTFIEYLMQRFEAEENQLLRDGLARVLANRMEYLMLKLLAGSDTNVPTVIQTALLQGKHSSVMGFLNRNTNIELENRILDILRPALNQSAVLEQDCRTYLKERILSKLGLQPAAVEPAPRPHSQPGGKIAFLLVLLFFAAAAVPLLYSVLHYHEWHSWSPYQHTLQYVLDFNYFLGYYSLALNSICLLLVYLSFRSAREQMRLWHLKKPRFLAKPRILPGITVIAPAYREEATIVESVHSLLNLRYPNYEVIVVNDGSPDNTLDVLFAEFNLEKIDMVLPQKLKTMPIVGVYANKSLPRLLVIDKINGGKADALNAGINLSDKEYFCGIDADSLLESDSLGKLASLTLDSTTEALALGGNILPINGCTVERGMLAQIGLPSSHLARLQTIEYLRAFMTGRLGWASINSLLIISGAFGLFRKDRIIEFGGYLTRSERFQLDTVGEDMELVVRLERSMLEANKPFAIFHSYSSNCWTEVPESLRVLYRQRDRWQRGLIDVIYFHRAMFLSPTYKGIGLLALPYFVLFELLGPLIETQGYIMVALAAWLGILNPEIALLLFAASVLYGIVVSIVSLAIAVEDNRYFSAKELLLLTLYAIAENFGIRQFLSFWRVTGFFSSLGSAQGWGIMPRKGIGTAAGSGVSKSA